ncbi:MAG: peptidoglycan-binding protein, partial [Bacillus sp. (in: Bacteria)]|nr:peptidoglycan-binding protein [Bacillus sp. (in: firmicutes)]
DEGTLQKIKDVLNSPMRNGQSSAEIQEMKRNIARLGFANWNILNISPAFGAGTEAAVRSFQSYYRLPVSGIAEEVTLRKIEELMATPLKTGDSNLIVQKMKRDITRLGFTSWNINNVSPTFGVGTKAAVKDVQRLYGLEENGIADWELLRRIEANLYSPMQNGNSSSEILELKRNIVRLGFADWNIPNISTTFGAGTEAAVRSFQKFYGLPVNGIVEELTLKKVDKLLTTPLKMGDTNPAVRKMKRDITRLGFTTWNINNVSPTFGVGTKAAILDVQRYYGLEETGIADWSLLQRIEGNLHSPMQLGNNSEAIQDLKRKIVHLGFATWNIDNVSRTFEVETEEAVRKIQKYYGLVVNGIADDVTLRKIEDTFSSSMQIGNSSEEIRELKRNLSRLGITNWNINNVSPVFGAGTEEAVRDFQRYYGLVENGIADSVTLRKIDEILSSPMQRGNSSSSIQELKRNLTRLGFTTWNINAVSPTFGVGTEEAVRFFQSYYGLVVNGIAEEVTLRKVQEVLNSPMQNGNRSSAIQELKRNLVRLGYANWNLANINTVFGDGTEAVVRAFQSDNGLVVNGIADSVTLAKIEELLKELIIFTDYDYSLDHMVNIQAHRGPRTDMYSQRIAYVWSEHIERMVTKVQLWVLIT